MDSSSTSRSLPVTLPRFSLAALLLALGLAALMAMVVGIAAFTIHSGSGISQEQLVVAKRLAYQQGHDAGYAAGVVKGKSTGHDDSQGAVACRHELQKAPRKVRPQPPP